MPLLRGTTPAMKSSRPGPSAKSGLFRSSSFFAVDEADLVSEDAAEDHDGAAAIVDLQAALPPRDALMVALLSTGLPQPDLTFQMIFCHTNSMTSRLGEVLLSLRSATHLFLFVKWPCNSCIMRADFKQLIMRDSRTKFCLTRQFLIVITFATSHDITNLDN